MIITTAHVHSTRPSRNPIKAFSPYDALTYFTRPKIHSSSSSSMNGKKLNDSRDVFGRDLSYLLSCHPGLEQLNKIDLYSHEPESGYTPLHVCLRLGHLEKAFKLYERWKKQQSHFRASKENIWDLKDREGLTPIELYQCENDIWNYQSIPTALYPEWPITGPSGRISSIVQWKPRSIDTSVLPLRRYTVEEIANTYRNYRGGRELLTTGSNTHLQLGTGDSENRQELYKLNEYSLYPEDACQRTRFRAAVMKRYHSLLVTTEGDVFTAGSGSRGRLGNGDTTASNVCHTKISLDSERVKLIDSSDHHSIVLTTSGEIFCWGWNRYSQLGYSTPAGNVKKLDNSALENICSPKPKRIVSAPWKKNMSAVIKYVACSKVHSCLVDDNNYLFSWGLNLGQMGTAKNYDDNYDALHAGHKGWIVSPPCGVKLPAYVTNIRQLLCTEFATFILFEDNQLCVLNNFKILRFSIPKAVSKQQPSSNGFDVFVPTSLSKNNKVLELKTAHSYGNNMCFLYGNGSVGILQSDLINNSTHGWSKLPNLLPVTQYWIPYFSWNKCLDFDVGAKGQLVLCTVNGNMFKCETSGSPKFHRQRSNKLISGKCVLVSCDSFFSSFALIKDDVDMIPLGFPKQSLYKDIAAVSPLSEWPIETHRRLKCEELKDKPDSSFLFDSFVKPGASGEHSDKEFSVPEMSNLPFPNNQLDSLWSGFLERWSKKTSFDQSKVFSDDSNWKYSFFNAEGARDRYDVLFVDENTGQVVGGCHRALLTIRAPYFTAQLLTFGSYTPKHNPSLNFVLKSDLCGNGGCAIIQLVSKNIDTRAICCALHYMYTDVFPDFGFISELQEKKYFESSAKQFMKVFDLHLTTFRGDKLPFALAKLLEQSNAEQEVSARLSPDVMIELSDGEKFHAHSFILKNRSAFFESALSKRWLSSTSNLKVLKMHRVSRDELLCIMKYIYGFSLEELFTHCEFDGYKEFVNFVLGLIQASDKFMMSGMKHYLESILIDYIDSSTVMVILVNAHRLYSKALIIECCWFLQNNIGLLFCDGNFKIINEYFDSCLWRTIQDFFSSTRSVNSIGFQTWYDEEGHSSHTIRLFESNIKKFNEIFMEPTNLFEPSFELGAQQKKLPTVKKSSDRRKSSSARKMSLSQEDLANVRRPLSGAEETKKQGLNLNYSYVAKNSDEAVFDDWADTSNSGFVTVAKSKRRFSKSSSTTQSVEFSASKAPSASSSLNVAMFENAKRLDSQEISSQEPIPNHASMFPVLGNAVLYTTPPGEASKVASSSVPVPFAMAKKVSQKERLKTLAAENKQAPVAQKKPVWGGKTSKATPVPAHTAAAPSASKFPSLSQSLHYQAPKKKAHSQGLTSTGESCTIPLYLGNTNAATAKPARSLKETIEEERFAKWWAEESERVQQELKRQEAEERDALNHIYPSGPSSRKKNVKKQKPQRPVHRKQAQANTLT
ncbi:LAQU0S02e01288g1_1 [Lachancea quebecensis]|uniref:LAQU0S02e01288g1_1 n=1 Tax=Lachancea quebecensis TaxID=1654605 RepID=A0A0P1KNY4_9SACH|nr:LAQU0S02e01288g1_1 [Lachancea quebecensis]